MDSISWWRGQNPIRPVNNPTKAGIPRRRAALLAVVSVIPLVPILDAAVASAHPLAAPSAPAAAVAAPVYGTPVRGDWDGDGIDTVAWFDRGTWTLYPDHQGKGTPTRFRYGTTGDRPVAGDWDGDGRDGIGVVRGNQWLLHPTASSGAATTTLSFGKPTDVPLTGDWDRDGRDGIGVWRQGTWFLRSTATTAGTTAPGFSFGRAADVPVIGDWDGDGIDGLGVLRGNSWYLRNQPSAGAAANPFSYGRSGDRPLAGDWNGDRRDGVGVLRSGIAYLSARPGSAADQGLAVPWLAGADAGTCPTGAAPADGSWVTRPAHLDLAVATPAAADATAKASLADAVRWQLVTAFDNLWGPQSGSAFIDVRGSTAGPGAAEATLRRPAMGAEAIAVAIRTGVPLARSRAFAIEHVRRLVRSAACQHRANVAGGWPDAQRDGNGSADAASWQSALWARDLGQAGWLLWDSLLPGERNAVAAMVIDEADRLTATPPRAWTDAAGTIITPGNTAFEEVAWNLSLLQTALAMMPTHPHASAWRDAGTRYALTASATVEDLTSDEPVDGAPVRSWITGANVRSDGTVDNHGVHGHPDYATTLRDLLGNAPIAALANRAPIAGTAHNAALIYGALHGVDFPAGGFAYLDTQGDDGHLPSPTYDEPGGTIYQPDGTVYYPHASVWGGVGRARFAALDELVASLALDPSAAGYAALHGSQARSLQARSADGRTFVSASEFPYGAREEFEASALSQRWLTVYLRRAGVALASG